MDPPQAEEESFAHGGSILILHVPSVPKNDYAPLMFNCALENERYSKKRGKNASCMIASSRQFLTILSWYIYLRLSKTVTLAHLWRHSAWGLCPPSVKSGNAWAPTAPMSLPPMPALSILCLQLEKQFQNVDDYHASMCIYTPKRVEVYTFSPLSW